MPKQCQYGKYKNEGGEIVVCEREARCTYEYYAVGCWHLCAQHYDEVVEIDRVFYESSGLKPK